MVIFKHCLSAGRARINGRGQWEGRETLRRLVTKEQTGAGAWRGGAGPRRTLWQDKRFSGRNEHEVCRSWARSD